jgi:phosphatidylserine decarboxylase
MEVKQGEEMGFIKFGSRVDLLLPLDARVNVKIGDKPQGGVTVIATW